MLKKLWKSITAKEDDEVETKVSAEINSLNQLNVGDFIKIGACDVFELSDKTLEVNKINVISGANARKIYVLEDNAGELFRAIIINDGLESKICVSKLIPKADVCKIFKEEDIGDVLCSDADIINTLKVRKKAGTGDWNTRRYVQELFSMRDSLNGKDFDYYRFIDDSRSFVIEINVINGGRTDIYFGRIFNEDIISEFNKA